MALVYKKLIYTGKRTWEEVPDGLKRDVKRLLKDDVANGVITPEKYQEITGEPYVPAV